MSNQTEPEHVFMTDRIKKIKGPIMFVVYTALGATFLIGMISQYS